MKHSAELANIGLGAYIDHGFIAMEDERESVSKALEYAYDDWCIAQVARRWVETDGLERYMRARAVVQERLRSGRALCGRARNGGWARAFRSARGDVCIYRSEFVAVHVLRAAGHRAA